MNVLPVVISKKRSRRWKGCSDRRLHELFVTRYDALLRFHVQPFGMSSCEMVSTVRSDRLCWDRRIFVALFLSLLLRNCNAWSQCSRSAPMELFCRPQTSFMMRSGRSGRRTRELASWSTETDNDTDIITNAPTGSRTHQRDDDTSSSGSDSFWVSNERSVTTVGPSEDLPLPTENGGYSHTKASKAKISAANKGKTPWNKGVTRTEETKAKIGLGVRAKNRERFLEKLADLGLTEEEFEDQKRKERREKDAEKRARKTENGGYRPTDETRRKISEILKQKHAAGEIKPRSVNPDNVRRGFTHTEETRRKISESLRQRWATDTNYRAKMVQISNSVNTLDSVRQKISDSLREKWRDTEFREMMLSKIANRKPHSIDYHRDQGHRDKISAAMKEKWQDAEYRAKSQASMARRKTALSSIGRAPKHPNTVSETRMPSMKRKQAQEHNTAPQPPLKNSSVSSKQQRTGKFIDSELEDEYDTHLQVRALQPRTQPHDKDSKTGKKSPPKRTKASQDSNMDVLSHVNGSSQTERGRVASLLNNDNLLGLDDSDNESIEETDTVVKKTKGSKKAPQLNGSVDLLKEERRDLYDLLYSDDDTDSISLSNDQSNKRTKSDGNHNSHTLESIFTLEDENLDHFDPYGLDDF